MKDQTQVIKGNGEHGDKRQEINDKSLKMKDQTKEINADKQNTRDQNNEIKYQRSNPKYQGQGDKRQDNRGQRCEIGTMSSIMRYQIQRSQDKRSKTRDHGTRSKTKDQ